MCGIAGMVGSTTDELALGRMVEAISHRGPDAWGIYSTDDGVARFGHRRLSIIDLSEAGRQPLHSVDGSLSITYNGEIYNFLELRRELADYPFATQTDTEVVLAAYERWGEQCLDRFVGMFSFAIWDARNRRLFAARDRFGVKPFYYHTTSDGSVWFASEIKALHAAGVPVEPDATTWASYFAAGLYGNGDRTFWRNVAELPAGCTLTWENGRTKVRRWYDLAARVGEAYDERSIEEVSAEYEALLLESLSLRFRADVPVAINVSGGLDSSTLLGLVRSVFGAENRVTAFTFITGDDRYDELPWVANMVSMTRNPLLVSRLDAEDVPRLAESIQHFQDEPYGGLPTIAYARLFEMAREEGIKVLLDGQGMDEQWAGYDYYEPKDSTPSPVVQGSKDRAVRPECLDAEFRRLAELPSNEAVFSDRLRSLQHRDATSTKIPRALRFNDRVSMRSSTELREPFLDHRLFELAMRQPADRKIGRGASKWMLRQIARRLLPDAIVEAPKRPLQTPQREWLRGPLAGWADDCIESALAKHGGAWLDAEVVRRTWRAYQRGESDTSFYVWQWINLGLMSRGRASHAGEATAVAVG